MGAFVAEDYIILKYLSTTMGNLKTDYRDYLITEPINCDAELLRVPSADYDLCAVLLTMLLREDHFSNGSLMYRYQAGQVDAILNRMIEQVKALRIPWDTVSKLISNEVASIVGYPVQCIGHISFTLDCRPPCNFIVLPGESKNNNAVV